MFTKLKPIQDCDKSSSMITVVEFSTCGLSEQKRKYGGGSFLKTFLLCMN